ncbi:50S ribosomal protein L10 [Candidatus Beckwithbacteria bacterium RBG_13_42_9]|uniref:Large ribosomal subunit protein uL10 n=1 Tax=Candidatus Beckwithbacteria bacterium RBG_13_42_9 TaxID=1797457 RepID=A0A1F5E6L1_9BACT|nr:MAG: 50S ribosomal protein L10 [Candidatus Beckwithbacteria bacterium RBG_13_42_9]
MPSQKNTQQLEALKEKAAKAKSIALTDYRGLTVAQMTNLRNKVREAGGELHVAKNTLLKLALQSDELNQTNALEGPTLTLFAYEDEVAPIKAIVDFAKENELPHLKAGFLGQDFLNKEKLLALAKLPAREQLYAHLVGQLNAPISGFVNVLSANIRNLVYVLSAIKDKNNH